MTTLFLSSGDLLADRRFAYAQEFAARGDLAAAADLLTQTVAAAPRFASAWFALGDVQERLRKPAEAAQAFERARALDDGDRHGAGLRLARLGRCDTGMPPAYVETLFDQYADRFDRALVDGLAYRGPALLRSAVEETAGSRRFARMLDLGCGTGLAGEAFRDLADRITGIDLSTRMLALARAKGIYTDLVQADIVGYLQGQASAACDLIVAADVFAYLTDLAPVCAAAAHSLAPGGVFAFTVETHAGDDVVLGHKLRYAHGTAHVRAAVAGAGLTKLNLRMASSRLEAGAPVDGLVVTVHKNG